MSWCALSVALLLDEQAQLSHFLTLDGQTQRLSLFPGLKTD